QWSQVCLSEELLPELRNRDGVPDLIDGPYALSSHASSYFRIRDDDDHAQRGGVVDDACGADPVVAEWAAGQRVADLRVDGDRDECGIEALEVFVAHDGELPLGDLVESD